MERLNDAFATWYSGGGIFTALQALTPGVPWKSLNIASQLDLEYHGNVSGLKIISPLIHSIQTGTALSSQEIAQLASIIESINSVSWAKEYATLAAQYAPVENYDMTETMTNDQTSIVYGHSNSRTNNLTHAKTGTETQRPDLTDERTANLTHAKTGTEEQTPDLTEVVTHDTSDERTDDLTDETTYGKTDTRTDNDLTTTNSVSAYNVAASYTPSGRSVSTGSQTNVGSGTDSIAHTGTSTLTKTGTDTTTKEGTDTLTYNTSETDAGTDTMTHTGSDTMTYNTSDTDTGTQTDTESGTDTHTRNYTLRRHGNIGVTTSQQLLQSERELWLWNYFRNVVFPDVDRVLTSPIY